jgi:aspartate racemase
VLVKKRIELAGFKRVGLLATPTTLTSTLYDEVIGDIAEIIRPDITLAKIVEEYIYKQLGGSLSEAERSKFRRMVANFKEQNKLDAVILACTELPLVYGQTNEPVILDTLQILSDELLAVYFAG